MEFWGVEVKNGVSLAVDPGNDMIVHISHAALGEKANNGNAPVHLYLKVGDQKLMVGTLSHEKIPQLSTEIVLEKPFELSHNWKDGSVFFTGYKVDAYEPDADDVTDDEKAPAVARSEVKQVNFQLPNEDVGNDEDSEDDTGDDDSSEESEEEKEKKATVDVEGDEDDEDEDDEDDSSDDDEDDDSSEDDDTPEKVEESKKRSADTNALENPASNKKAKFVTPQKTETKKPHHVHIATPHPSKQGGKNSGSNGEASSKTPKSAGAFGCKSCNRTFGSEMGLQSHTKAKHSAAA